MREFITLFRALSDGTRLRIVKLLENGELCVCHLMEILEMSQSRISRHMGLLKNAGLVNDRREGRWVHYSLNEETHKPGRAELIRLLQGWIEEEAVVAADRRRLVECLARLRAERVVEVS